MNVKELLTKLKFVEEEKQNIRKLKKNISIYVTIFDRINTESEFS